MDDLGALRDLLLCSLLAPSSRLLSLLLRAQGSCGAPREPARNLCRVVAHFFSNPGSCSGPCRTHVLHVGFLHEPTGVETKGPLVPCMLLCTQLPRLSFLQKYEYHSSQLSLTLLASLELYWWMGSGRKMLPHTQEKANQGFYLGSANTTLPGSCDSCPCSMSSTEMSSLSNQR